MIDIKSGVHIFKKEVKIRAYRLSKEEEDKGFRSWFFEHFPEGYLEVVLGSFVHSKVSYFDRYIVYPNGCTQESFTLQSDMMMVIYPNNSVKTIYCPKDMN
jgi:hypothetical protein